MDYTLQQTISIKMWEPPYSKVLRNGYLLDTSNPLAIVFLLHQLDTAQQMGGLLSFYQNSHGDYLPQTIEALSIVGAKQCEATLITLQRIANEAGMTREALRGNLNRQKKFQITNWRKSHGRKWDVAAEAIDHLYHQYDNQELSRCLNLYYKEHSRSIAEAFSKLDH